MCLVDEKSGPSSSFQAESTGKKTQRAGNHFQIFFEDDRIAE